MRGFMLLLASLVLLQDSSNRSFESKPDQKSYGPRVNGPRIHPQGDMRFWQVTERETKVDKTRAGM